MSLDLSVRIEECRGAAAARFLASLAAATCAAETTAKGRVFPSVAVRYADPATEFTVVRLTDPQFTSSLPAAGNRGVTARQLLYASDMSGSWQAFRMDLKSKESRQLTDAEHLDPASIGLLEKRKRLLAFRWPQADRDDVLRSEIPRALPDSRGLRKITRRQLQRRRPVCGIWVEKGASSYRLQLLHIQHGTAQTLIESPEELSDPLLRPHNTSLVYRSRGELWSIRFDGQQNRRLPLAEGETLQAQWAADGHALEYLNRPADPRKLATLREWTPGKRRAGRARRSGSRYQPVRALPGQRRRQRIRGRQRQQGLALPALADPGGPARADPGRAPGQRRGPGGAPPLPPTASSWYLSAIAMENRQFTGLLWTNWSLRPMVVREGPIMALGRNH